MIVTQRRELLLARSFPARSISRTSTGPRSSRRLVSNRPGVLHRDEVIAIQLTLNKCFPLSPAGALGDSGFLKENANAKSSCAWWTELDIQFTGCIASRLLGGILARNHLSAHLGRQLS